MIPIESEQSSHRSPKAFHEVHPDSHRLATVLPGLIIYGDAARPEADLGSVLIDVDGMPPLTVRYLLSDYEFDGDPTGEPRIAPGIIISAQIPHSLKADMNAPIVDMTQAWAEFSGLHRRLNIVTPKDPQSPYVVLSDAGAFRNRTRRQLHLLVTGPNGDQVLFGNGTQLPDLAKQSVDTLIRSYSAIPEFSSVFLPFFLKRKEAQTPRSPGWLSELIGKGTIDTEVVFHDTVKKTDGGQEITFGYSRFPFHYENSVVPYAWSEPQPFIAVTDMDSRELSFGLALPDHHARTVAEDEEGMRRRFLDHLKQSTGNRQIMREMRLFSDDAGLQEDIRRNQKNLTVGINTIRDETGRTRVTLGFQADTETIRILHDHAYNDTEIIEETLRKLGFLYPRWSEFVYTTG